MEDEQLERVLGALKAIRCGAAPTEEELHRQVLDALTAAGLQAQHEVALGRGCRIDVMCGSIGVEIKKSRPQRAALMRQLARYAAFEQVGQLLVIAPRGVSLPGRIGGKRVTVLALERLWGISLP